MNFLIFYYFGKRYFGGTYYTDLTIEIELAVNDQRMLLVDWLVSLPMLTLKLFIELNKFASISVVNNLYGTLINSVAM